MKNCVISTVFEFQSIFLRTTLVLAEMQVKYTASKILYNTDLCYNIEFMVIIRFAAILDSDFVASAQLQCTKDKNS